MPKRLTKSADSQKAKNFNELDSRQTASASISAAPKEPEEMPVHQDYKVKDDLNTIMNSAAIHADPKRLAKVHALHGMNQTALDMAAPKSTNDLRAMRNAMAMKQPAKGDKVASSGMGEDTGD